MTIDFDIKSLTEQMEEDYIRNLKGGVETIPIRVAHELHNQISRVAAKELNSTFQRFMSDFSIEVRQDRVIVKLGEFAYGIDQGFPERNMRDRLNKPNAKKAKDGRRYVDIPFMQATPSSNMRGGEDWAGRLDRETYIAVREAGELFFTGDKRGNPVTNSFGYVHKNHIYHNLRKYEKPGIGQNRYISFRRLSDESDPNAFRIRKTDGYKIIEKAINQFDYRNINRMKLPKSDQRLNQSHP